VIYSRQSIFLMPTEGAGEMLQRMAEKFCMPCTGGAIPANRHLFLALFTNQPTIDCALTRADLVFATFTGSAPIELADATGCTGNMQGPGEDVDGVWKWIMDQQEFEWTAGAVESVYGAVLISVADGDDPEDDGFILGVDLFPNGPVPMGAAGDKIKLTGLLPLECNIPALPDE